MDAKSIRSESAICACVCVIFGREKRVRYDHLVGWLENWYKSRWEKRAKMRETNVRKKKSFHFQSIRCFVWEKHIHTQTHTDIDSCARVCVLVWHRNVDNCDERKFQAVPFHCTHTNAHCDWHLRIHSVACLCVSPCCSASQPFTEFTTIRKQQATTKQMKRKKQQQRFAWIYRRLIAVPFISCILLV